MDLVYSDPSKSLAQGAMSPWNPISSQYTPELCAQAATAFKVRMEVSFKKQSKRERNVFLNGRVGKPFHFH